MQYFKELFSFCKRTYDTDMTIRCKRTPDTNL